MRKNVQIEQIHMDFFYSSMTNKLPYLDYMRQNFFWNNHDNLSLLDILPYLHKNYTIAYLLIYESDLRENRGHTRRMYDNILYLILSLLHEVSYRLGDSNIEPILPRDIHMIF